jgi:hypothetical protein
MTNFKECKICKKIFNYQCGEFSEHLKKEHNFNRREYIILTEYANKVPKCECGYCDEDAKFLERKNIFLNIKYEHRKFDWLKKKYIEKNGIPLCKSCKNTVNFNRGIPNLYCSYKCLPSNWNQKKIKNTLLNKYGVDNAGKIEGASDKAKFTKFLKYGDENYVNVQKSKKTKKEKYGNENYINLEKIKISNYKKYGVDSFSKTESFKKMASDTVIKTNEENKFSLIKRYKNTELYYQGTYEYRFLEYCEKNNIINFIKRSKSFYYLEGDTDIGLRHLPDFVFKNKFIIEVKSTYILEKQGGWNVISAKKRSVEKFDYVYVLILDNNFENLNDILSI